MQEREEKEEMRERQGIEQRQKNRKITKKWESARLDELEGQTEAERR